MWDQHQHLAFNLQSNERTEGFEISCKNQILLVSTLIFSSIPTENCLKCIYGSPCGICVWILTYLFVSICCLYIFNGYYCVELAPIILVAIWIAILFIVHCMTKKFRTGNITFRELEEFNYPVRSYHYLRCYSGFYYRQIQIARSFRRLNLARSTIPRIPSISRITPTLQRQISLPSYENESA